MNIQPSQRISSAAPYPFAQINQQVDRLKAQGVEVIDFGVGDPQEPTPAFIIEALKRAAVRRASAGYPSYSGELEFRQAAARYLEREFGVKLDPATEITSTIGAKEAVFNFPLAFVDPGDVVICPTPGYPPYKNGTCFAGGVPYFVPLLAERDFLIDLQAIPKGVVKQAKIIWLNYPNSPTGKIVPKNWLADLASWARQHNIIIAADEGCYIDIYFNQKPVSILEIAKEGVITFYSLSKRNNMSGYRVGFCAGDEQIIKAFQKVKTNIDSGTPTFIQDAAIAALGDVNQIKQLRGDYHRKMDIMITALTKAGLPECPSEATFYIWQRAPKGITGLELANRFLKLGIVVTPGEWLADLTKEGINPGFDYVRLALVPRLGQIKEAARRLKKFYGNGKGNTLYDRRYCLGFTGKNRICLESSFTSF